MNSLQKDKAGTGISPSGVVHFGCKVLVHIWCKPLDQFGCKLLDQFRCKPVDRFRCKLLVHYSVQNNSFVQTSPVAAFAQGASWSGALGLGGNVSEWVSDWLGPYSPEAVSNPTGPPEGAQKMVKGGSWFFHPTYCRGASRASVDPGTRFDYLGFRCAASLGE
jgi:formylglycine-generating enzyme required for sulfatase activity